MKIRFIIIPFFALLLTGCIKIEDIPIIEASPSVSILTHVVDTTIYATFTLTPNVTFIVAGNVGLSYNYEGIAKIIDLNTGEQIGSSVIQDEGATQVITVPAPIAGVDGIVMIAAGKLDVYGEDSDNTFLTTAPFYGEEQLVFSEEVIPELDVNPTVTIDNYISAGTMYATISMYANPEFRTVGTIPVYYKYVGRLSFIDLDTDKPLSFGFNDTGGKSFIFNLGSRDVSGINSMLIKVDGQVDAFYIVPNSIPKDTVLIHSGLFYAEQEVVINP